jgi:hypothetical protein
MRPNHGINLGPELSPFKISASNLNDDKFIVSIYAKNDKTFRGFLLEAKETLRNSQKAVGQWKTNVPYTKTIQCNSVNSAVTQSNSFDFQDITFTWTYSNLKN